MGYKDMAKEAIEQKTVKDLMPAFVQFKDEGDGVVGRYISRSEVVSKKNTGTYFDYVFDTDDGAVHFACGGQFDSKVGNTMVTGHIYSIEYKGKRPVGGGHQVNEFSCLEIPDPMAR